SPPMAGLQDIAPTLANWWVIKAVCAPMRAAAAAASQPAWPPPITTTSNRLAIDTSEAAGLAKAGLGVQTTHCGRMFHVKHPCPIPARPVGALPGLPALLADAEIAKNDVENIFDIDSPGKSTKGSCSGLQLLGQQVLAARDVALQCSAQCIARAF